MSFLRLLAVAVSTSMAAAACAGAALDDARHGAGLATSGPDSGPPPPFAPASASTGSASGSAPDAGATRVDVAPRPIELDGAAPSGVAIFGVLGGDSGAIQGVFHSDQDLAEMLEPAAEGRAGAVGVGGLGIGDAGAASRYPAEGSLGARSGFGGGGRVGGARAPRVASGKEQVTAGLPKEVIQRVVRGQLVRVRACYQTALARNPTLAGKVSVRFTIDRAGGVASARAESGDLQDSALLDCTRRVFAGLRFPAPEGTSEVTVLYPLSFQPGDDAAASPSTDGGAAGPTHLGGKPIAEATLADLQVALRAGGWTVPSFTRRPATKAAAAIVDLVAVKNAMRARIVFRPAVREGGPVVTSSERARLFAEGAVTDIGDFYLAVVVEDDPKQAEPLRAALFACCRGGGAR